MEKLGEVLARVAEQLGMKAAELWPKVVLYHWVVNLVLGLVLFSAAFGYWQGSWAAGITAFFGGLLWVGAKVD